MDLRRHVVLAVMTAVVLICCAAGAGELEDQGRAILERHQKAVVTVQLVVKQKLSMGGMGAQEDESKSEATGFVIAPDGLTVLALSATDPTSLIENMMSGMGEMASRLKVDSDIADVKILLDDGTEIPAKVVLRDKDLDLAYVRPLEAPRAPLPAIDLGGAAEPAILEPVITLNRLGKVAGRTCAVSVERIQAIIRKPRTFYVPGKDPTHSGAGSPVFTADGKVVGMIAVRTIKTEGRGGLGAMFGGGMAQGMIGVVVPAEDILEGAQQAPLPAGTSSEDTGEDAGKE